MTETTPAPTGQAVTAPPEKLQLNQIVGRSGATGGGVTFLPRTMQECVDFATIMSKSDFAIPPQFRRNPGACLAVVIQSCRWEADPFGVIQKAYITKSKGGDERLAYEAQLIAAVVNTRAGLAGRLQLIYSGDGSTRKVKVIGRFADTGEERDVETPTVGKIKVKNSPLWESDPDQQLAYYGMRAWGRRWTPEVLLGMYTPEELQEPELVDAPRPTRDQVQVIEANVDEGVVRQAVEEPAVEARDEIEAQAAAMVPSEDDVVEEAREPSRGVTAEESHRQAAPINADEAARLDEMRVGEGEDEDAESEAFQSWSAYLLRAKDGLKSPELQTEKDLDDYAAATKKALAEADGITEDERDDLRARFASAFLEEKRERRFTRKAGR
jgi:hypothetical protein